MYREKVAAAAYAAAANNAMARFRDCAVVVIASGPSLTPEDVEAVRKWREAADDRRVIAVNTSFRAALWADAMYATDDGWWKCHADECVASFPGARLSGCVSSSHRGAVMAFDLSKLPRASNSGGYAIALAAYYHARRVVMLGFDAAVRWEGQRRVAHWHGAHPLPLGDAGSIDSWPRKFERLANTMKTWRPQCAVVNASRQTALTMFPRVSLEDALQ